MRDARGLPAWVQMLRTFGTMQSIVESSLSQYDLTLAQFNLLVVLSFHQDKNQNELSAHLGVTKGNVVGLLDRLSRRGLVERVPMEGDLRVNHPRLTGAGRALINETLPEQVRVVVEMMNPLTDTELGTLEQSLKKLEEANAGTKNARQASIPPIAIRKAI